MHWYEWLLIIFAWSALGGLIMVIAYDAESEGAMAMADSWEFVNPVHVYKYNKVNWFGAIIVALVYNVLCPVGSVCYWCYKLCTVGRK